MGKVLKKEMTDKDPIGLAATVLYVSGLKTGEKKDPPNYYCSRIRGNRSNN
jgi:hypothetical protein